MTTLVDDAGTDDEEERASKAAFFHELERRHGGPLSYEELQEFEPTERVPADAAISFPVDI